MQPFLHRSGTPAAPSTYSPNLVISVESALLHTYTHTHRHRPIHFIHAYKYVNMRIHANTYEHTYERMPYKTQHLYFEFINIAELYKAADRKKTTGFRA